MYPLITIIVPVYKVEAYLDDCVKSILSQKFQDFELILIDDGSPDNCPELCDMWSKKDTRIRVIHKANGGLSDSRNYGIEEAIGEYVWFVDSDDWVAEDSLSIIHKSILSYPDADAIATKIVEIRNGSVRFNGIQQEWPKSPVLLNNAEYVEHFTSVLPSVRYIVKRHVYADNNLRFIVGVLHEDIPFCHMLMNFTKKIAVIPEITYYYRIRSGSITTSPNINSCYSLVKSHKELIRFSKENVTITDSKWFRALTYDIFYEMFLRAYPFVGKQEFDDFMFNEGKYVKHEFWKLRSVLTGKRLMLLFIFKLSPQLYSRLINLKRNR